MRKHLQKFFLVTALLICSASTAVAQTTVKGKIVDENNAPLIGATVTIPGTSQGTGADVDGSFTLRITPDVKVIEINYIGYALLVKEISGKTQDLGYIKMTPDALLMQDVVITQSIAKQRETPVAASTISAADIEYKIGNKEFPEVLKSTPGVYVTKDGGGYGDSKILMRGFEQSNVAVMVNGVPVNDMEWGGVYWSNWAGLSEVTRSMQTQRGIGASKVATPTVGGTINIVTRSIDAKRGGSVSYSMGNDGRQGMSFSVSSGLNDNGWAFTLFGSRTWGDGYIQGTDFEGYNYFVNISKRINADHQLSFTVTGAPQTHGQRNNRYGVLTVDGYEKVAKYMNGDSPYRYNAQFGYDRYGNEFNSGRNTYHKPQIALNHQWQIDHKSSLSTAVYASIGRGHGTSGQGRDDLGYSRSDWNGTDNGVLTMKYRNSDGTFDYGAMQDINAKSTQGSMYVLSNSINEHIWYGVLSTYSNQLTETIELSGGVDVRYYKATHTNEIGDLFGGQYYSDFDSRENVRPSQNSAALNPDWVNEKLTVGDVVYRDYDGHVHQEGLFAQVEYSKNRLNAFVSGSVSNTGYWRYDRFYYDAEHARSDNYNFLGGIAKAGANYNFDEKHNVFINGGYISRAPFFSRGVFLSNTTSNMANPDPVNEKIASVELGYGFRSQLFSANVNAYYTKWMDKTEVRSKYMEGPGDYATLNMTGVDARHMGIEIDFTFRPARWVNITGMASLGDWIWDSNATGYYYDSTGQPIANIMTGEIASGILADDHASTTLNQKGISVGGSAQTTASLGLDFFPYKGLRISADWFVAANNYADYYINPNETGAVVNVAEPWKIPWGQQVDLSASYGFKLGDLRATIYGNVNNIFDYNYIMDAQSSSSAGQDWQKAYGVIYSFGRTYSLRLKLNF